MLRPDEAVAAVLLEVTARVLRYLRFLGAGAAAEDVAQEALLAGLARWPDGRMQVPWLLATARNLWRRHLRTSGRRRELVDSDRLHELWVAEAGDDGGDGLRAALRACLQQLPERSRGVLELRYGEELERQDIAARLGLGDEGVKSLLARVRAALAECVQRRMRHDQD